MPGIQPRTGPKPRHSKTKIALAAIALADADCALAGQRVVQELLLAAERARQNGDPDQDVGDRVMEGLAMASLALNVFIQERVRPLGAGS